MEHSAEKLHGTETSNNTLNCTSSNSSKKDKKLKKMQPEKKGSKGVMKKTKNLKSKAKEVPSSNSKKSQRNCGKRTRYSDLYDDDVEAQFTVMERAGKLLSRLNTEVPLFVKCMLPSNVAQGFWLHLPRKFCNIHLPDHDTPIVLVDEWENEYTTTYLLDRRGLSAGWRGFAISHRLLKGDILIFQLTEPRKFKVQIVRVNGPDIVDAALCLMSLHSSGRGMDTDPVKRGRGRRKTKFVEPYTAPPEKAKGKSATNSVLAPVAHPTTSSSGGLSPEVLEGCEVTIQAQPNDLPYPKASFLHDHSREVVTCR